MSDNKQPKQKPQPAPRGKTYDPQRAAQEARRAAKRANARSQSARRRAVARARARSRARGVLGWLSWWATYEMDRRAKEGDDDLTTAAPVGGSAGTSVSAGGRDVTNVGGGFAWLREWGTRRTVAVLTLLVLAGFTGSIALGAGSLIAGIIAFLFFTAALAMATAARARYQYRRRPVDIQPPLETVSDFHIEDMEIDEPAPRGDVNTLDDLERSFGFEQDQTVPQNDSRAQLGSGKSEPDPQAPAPEAVTATATETKPARVPRMREPESPPANAPDSDAEPPASNETSELAAESQSRPARDTQEPDAAVTEDKTEPATEPATEVNGNDRASTEEAAADDAVDKELHAPLVVESADDTESENLPANVDTTVESAVATQDDADMTALSLLAAETPGQDLLAAYTAAETHLPPEAVRDVAATLIVSDLDRSLMFYTQLLGLVEIDRARDAVLLEAGFGRVLLWRRQDAPGTRDTAMHLTFEVGDINAAYQFLRSKGVVFTHAPRSALSGHVHELRAASFLDPDGHGLAITQLSER